MFSDNDYNKIQENLSHSYLFTLISHLHGSYARTTILEDEKGIDARGTLFGEWSSLPDASTQISIEFQLKSTSAPNQLGSGDFSFSIEADQYERYYALSQGTPPYFLLSLFILPPREEYHRWISFSKEELLLRGKMYWASLKNGPQPSGRSVSIHFLQKNRLDTDGLRNLLRMMAEAKEIPYEP